jgi:hypothetical protein
MLLLLLADSRYLAWNMPNRWHTCAGRRTLNHTTAPQQPSRTHVNGHQLQITRCTWLPVLRSTGTRLSLDQGTPADHIKPRSRQQQPLCEHPGAAGDHQLCLRCCMLNLQSMPASAVLWLPQRSASLNTHHACHPAIITQYAKPSHICPVCRDARQHPSLPHTTTNPNPHARDHTHAMPVLHHITRCR